MVLAYLSTLLPETGQAIPSSPPAALSSIQEEADKGLEGGEGALVGISIVIILVMCCGVCCCTCVNLASLPDGCERPSCTGACAKIISFLKTCVMFLAAAPLLWTWVLIPLYKYIGQTLTNFLGYCLGVASVFLISIGIASSDGARLGIALLFFFLCAGLLAVKKPLEGPTMNQIAPTLYLTLMIILFTVAASTLYAAPQKDNDAIILFLVLGIYTGITTLVLVWRKIPAPDAEGDHYQTPPV